MKWIMFLERDETGHYKQVEAMNDLYKKMFIVAYSKVHNKADALDIVQESWVKIIEKIDSLKEHDKFVQWAKVIVANTALNVIKRNQVLRVAPCDFDRLLSKDRLVDLEIEERFIRDVLVECVEQLDEQTRQIFIRKYYHNWGNKQIAEELDIPIGTVKSRIHRGTERLRAILSDELNPIH
ncbi:MAG TPA: sigma-70 family RNA polymerase sigma factor [Bacilli bacterium]